MNLVYNASKSGTYNHENLELNDTFKELEILFAKLKYL